MTPSSPKNAILLLALGVVACGEQADTSDAGADAEAIATRGRTVRVETSLVEQSSFMDVVELTGDVEAMDDATLSSQTAGTLIYLRPLGSRVEKGEHVARIDPGITDAGVEQADAQVAVAQAQFDLAKDTYQRQEPLFRDSVISALEFEEVRTRVSQAEAQLAQARALRAQAREQSRHTRISAPFAGRVEQHMVEVGEQLTPGTPIVRLVNASRVKITAGVPERYAGDIRSGSLVRVNFADYGLGTIEAQASFVGSVIDKASRTFPVEIVVNNKDGKLKPEMIAKVVVTRDVLQDAIVVPIASVLRDENGTNVFVAEVQGDKFVAVRKAVRVGPTYAGKAVILEGLESGERLITAGQNLLTPGDALEVLGRDGDSLEAGQPTALTSTE